MSDFIKTLKENQRSWRPNFFKIEGMYLSFIPSKFQSSAAKTCLEISLNIMHTELVLFSFLFAYKLLTLHFMQTIFMSNVA